MERAARLELRVLGEQFDASRFLAKKNELYVRVTFERSRCARDDDFRTIVASHHVK
jgi:hypothetical protein